MKKMKTQVYTTTELIDLFYENYYDILENYNLRTIIDHEICHGEHIFESYMTEDLIRFEEQIGKNNNIIFEYEDIDELDDALYSFFDKSLNDLFVRK